MGGFHGLGFPTSLGQLGSSGPHNFGFGKVPLPLFGAQIGTRRGSFGNYLGAKNWEGFPKFLGGYRPENLLLTQLKGGFFFKRPLLLTRGVHYFGAN